MKASLREGDTLARMGGDEFVVILVDLEQAQDCDPVLERLLLACAVIRRRFPVGESPTWLRLQPVATGAVMEVTK
jgi:GGDEF domain-containing protein